MSSGAQSFPVTFEGAEELAALRVCLATIRDRFKTKTEAAAILALYNDALKMSRERETASIETPQSTSSDGAPR